MTKAIKAAQGDRTPRRRREVPRIVWPVLALAAVLLFNALFTEGFFDIEVRDGRLFGSLIDVLNRSVPVVLLAMGMTLVIGTGGIDLSVGAVMAISATMAASLIARPDYSVLSGIDLGGSVALVLVATLAVAALCGVWNGLLVTRLDMQPIVATLILMVAGRGLAQVLSDGQRVPFADETLIFLGRGAVLGLPLPVFVAAGAFGATWLLTRRTALGLFIEAVGNNPSASRAAGLPARKVKVLCYAYCGLCAGVAGVIVAADNAVAVPSTFGELKELDAILAVCIGGTALTGGRFSLVGSLIGAVLIQALTTTILTLAIPREVTLVVEAVIVVVVCLLQSPRFAALFVRRRAAGGAA